MGTKKQVDHTGDRLTFDIEVSPCQGWFWRPGYKINIPASNVREHGKIICLAFKWENENKIHTLQWDKNQDDKKLLEEFVPTMQKAGTIIGHNSNGFDVKWIRTRCLYHGLPCPPDFQTIDTWLQAKKYFRLNGTGLKAIAKFLDLEGKLEPSPGLWEKVVFDKCPKAMKEMKKYCRRDVDQTEKVYQRFSQYTNTVGHVGNNMTQCPHCGGSDTRWEKDRITQKGGKHTQFRCWTPTKRKGRPVCGKYSTIASSKWYNETPINKVSKGKK
jgi:hypothetical protein